MKLEGAIKYLRFFRRKRVWIPLATSLLAFIALILWIHQLPYPIAYLARFLSFPVTVQEARWTSLSSIELQEIKMGDFAEVQSIHLKWNWWDLLWNQQFQLLKLQKPHFFTGKFDKSFPKKSDTPSDSSLRVGIEKIEIERGFLFIEEIAPRLNLPIPLGRDNPLTIHHFQWGNAKSQDAHEMQFLESSEIILHSPHDPLAPVLGFKSIKLHFTLYGLLHHEIDTLTLKDPTVYIGPDLFWFLDQVRLHPKPSSGNPWNIRHFEIESARMNISGFGNPGLEIPLYLSKKIENVRTDRLGEVFKMNDFEVRRGDYSYPSYGLEIHQLDGNVRFGLPLEEANAINQVIILKADSIEWKKLQINKPWISVTFDSRGIFGKIGGQAYNGYINGQCSVYFQPGFPWNASIHGLGMNIEEPLSKLGEDHFRMTGIMNVDIQVQAKSTVFEKSTGRIWLTGGGKMVIPAIDDVLQKLPPTWSPLKKQLSTIGLEAFKTFDYTKGTFDLIYDNPKSQAILDLEGKQGRRHFDLSWIQE